MIDKLTTTDICTEKKVREKKNQQLPLHLSQRLCHKNGKNSVQPRGMDLLSWLRLFSKLDTRWREISPRETPFYLWKNNFFFLEFSNDIAITRPTSLPRDCHGLKEDLLFWTFMSKLKTSLPVHRFNWIALLLKTQYNVNGVYAFHSKFM